MTCAVPWTVAKKTASAAVWFQLGPGRLNDNPLRRGARQIKPAKDSGLRRRSGHPAGTSGKSVLRHTIPSTIAGTTAT
jgi:hypothetical protein